MNANINSQIYKIFDKLKMSRSNSPNDIVSASFYHVNFPRGEAERGQIHPSSIKLSLYTFS